MGASECITLVRSALVLYHQSWSTDTVPYLTRREKSYTLIGGGGRYTEDTLSPLDEHDTDYFIATFLST